jgi:hypothetical protein
MLLPLPVLAVPGDARAALSRRRAAGFMPRDDLA